jgi:phosphopantothenoylcysteine decarboxylase/phosphopantothenate--cysteine ligase
MKPLRILITAGATREPIDTVRFISNVSTGKMGVEIAKEAARRGHSVYLLQGTGSYPAPEDILTARFTTTKDLMKKVTEIISDFDVYISAAAVSDYAPEFVDAKIGSNQEELVLRLKPTPKVIREAKKAARKDTLFVAFKLEYNKENIVEIAKKAYDDIADIIVVNDLADIDDSKHIAQILCKGRVHRASTKEDIAKQIIQSVENYDERESIF